MTTIQVENRLRLRIMELEAEIRRLTEELAKARA